ncbi:Hsp20/alpha crystallin family protein [Streptomyces sp. PmtG]
MTNLPARRPWGWDPVEEFEQLWNQMVRVFGPTGPGRGPAARHEGAWMPLAEEDETDDAFVVRLELPGVPRENIHVDVDENGLHITGELTSEQHGRVLARRTGRFAYSTTLGGGFDSERVSADLADGILTVRVPKSPGTKRRRVTVTG